MLWPEALALLASGTTVLTLAVAAVPEEPGLRTAMAILSDAVVCQGAKDLAVRDPAWLLARMS